MCVRVGTQHIPPTFTQALWCNLQYVGLDLAVAFHIAQAFPGDKFMHINCNIAEIWRWFNGTTENNRSRSGEYMQKALAIGMLQKDMCNINLASLHYWENRMARWLTDVWVATDPAFDTFNPLNARAIISVMLSKPSGFDSVEEIHRDLITQLDSMAL
jgi:hypothetical protein